ncbi:MAG: polysaccharide deacetylase family protein [Verrucomicrobiales bacterium]|nr:polysaccharide deacetylase family protein [Verrucomicrobiales bacterium]
MPDSRLRYYSRLAPFQRLFDRGVPILTYHKFGPRPRGVRLRGLYLPRRLLARQLREWNDGGFESVTLPEAVRPTNTRPIILTIDDGFRSVLEHALPLLVKHGYQATLYLVADRLGGDNDWEQAQGEVAAPLMTVAEVKEWLAAGQRIGSHTCTHPWLTRIPLAEAREEIQASRKKLEDAFGIEVKDFCYPYGEWNVMVRDAVEAAGYATATTTDFGVNTTESDRFALRRITARHTSWGWRAIRAWWRR